MIKYYLKTASRSFLKNKTSATINIIGLAIALLTVMNINNWIQHEVSYDNMHNDSDLIYRLAIGDKQESIVTISPAVKTKILNNIPEIQTSVRLFRRNFTGNKTKVSYKNRVFTNDELVYTDENFFSIFSFPLIKGNKEGIFEKPNSVLITQETAQKYFGSADPIGKTLMVEGKELLMVTGVFKSLPANSHFHFDMLVSMKSFPRGNIDEIGFGSGYIFHTYIKVHKNSNTSVLLGKIEEQIAKLNLSYDWKPKFFLQPIKEIHLYSHGEREFEANSDITMVYIFASIGFLVLFIASINYVNLTTAYSFRRAKEIGIRKTIGAERGQLIVGFLIESLLTVISSLILAFLLNEFAKPLISNVAGIDLEILQSSKWIGKIILFTFGLGIVIGLIPAAILSKISPVSLIKDNQNPASNRFDFKNLLLTAQFCITILLIFGTIIINNQMSFVKDKKLGYDKEKVLVLNIGYRDFEQNREAFKQSLLENHNISNVTSLSQLPSNIQFGEFVDLPDESKFASAYMSIDKDFFNTMAVSIINGKDRIENVDIDNNIDFSKMENRFVVNKSFLKKMGVPEQEALNQKIRIRHGNMIPGPIIGVIEDFHFQSLHSPITPLVLEFDPREYQHILVKLQTDDVQNTISFIEQEWAKVAGNLPFEYYFLDDAYNNLYKTESQFGALVLSFSIISIIIGAVGLFGLSLFYIERKIKEIGIRKVLGASIPNLYLILTKNFAKWIILASIIIWPLGYYLMNKWLENFAYHIDISIMPFVISTFVSLAITLIIVSWQSIKAANTNPVESLRNE
ncbi:MAG: ABC transporter permease [Ignavibacteriales bacterium]|nr:ABC transporter permease [Ignavibacteriota bacterium]MCB9219971.1 ABC transporter permease [Ignavibacteriales bacterium]